MQSRSSIISAVVFILFLLAANGAQAQNAFYDAKRLFAWKKMPDADPFKARDALVMEAILNKYFNDSTNWLDVNEDIYAIRKRVLAIGIETQHADVIQQKLMEFDYGNYGKKNSRKDAGRPGSRINEASKSEIADLEALVKKIKNSKRTIGYVLEKETEFNLVIGNWLNLNTCKKASALIKLFTVDNTQGIDTNFLIHDSGIDFQILDSLGKNCDSSYLQLDTLVTDTSVFIRTFNTKINGFRRIQEDSIKTFLAGLTSRFSALSPEVQAELVGQSYTTEQYQRKAELDREFMKNAVLTVSNYGSGAETDPAIKTSISDQNFPTQAEIIDALAIYISKRFKEDLALTFVENFARYLKDNSLARELFPSSFNMLLDSDPYSSPKIGTEWRNAVSTDLINLPENMVKSRIITQWLQNEEVVDYLGDAVMIGKYVAHKYNFTDMVRSIYLGNGVNGDNVRLKGTYTKRALLATYIINEEFFDTSYSRYWINAEQLARLNDAELTILGALLNQKYGDSLASVFGTWLPDSKEAIGTLVKLRNTYTDVLALLKQFEVSQYSAYLSNKQGGTLKDAFWDYQRIFIDFLEKQVKDEQAKAKVRSVKKMFLVYDYISNKNFGAAINSTLEILDTLLSKNSPSRFLRAFVNSKDLMTLEGYALSLKETDKQFAFKINSLTAFEELSRIKFMLASGWKHQVVTRSMLDTLYYKTYQTPLNKKNLGQLDSLLFDQTDANGVLAWNLVQKADNLYPMLLNTFMDTLQKLHDPLANELKSVHFHTFKSENDLNAYISLADRLILSKSPNLITSFRKISGFITDAATAKDSKELSRVMEAYAQPPLSYKLTRKSLHSIDLTAYVGVWAGKEFLFKAASGTSSNKSNKWNGVAGLTVPVGLSYSWGRKAKTVESISKASTRKKTDNRLFYLDQKAEPRYLRGSSFSIFLSIIDIAGPVSYRMGETEADGLPSEVSWSQILAPGIHFFHGIKNAPLALNVGFQISPQLRTFDDINAEPFSTGRIQFGLTYELPLLNFTRKIP